MPNRAIVLVRPSLPANIGLAARAVRACGLRDLRLVAPKNGWPQAEAIRAAAWAGQFLAEEVRCFATIEEATADLRGLVATSARRRAFNLKRFAPEDWVKGGGSLLFGNEQSGLSNYELSLCEGISHLEIGSLNLSQAVLAYCYELARAKPAADKVGGDKIAKTAELQGFYRHLETELEKGGFFHPPQIKAASRQKLRAIFSRAALAEKEIKMLRGVITSLSVRRRGEG